MGNVKIYKINRNGKEEEVAGERWRWKAKYKDGTELRQFDDETGLFHSFSEIDKENISTFTMYSLDVPDRAYDVVLAPWMKLIHYYHNTWTPMPLLSDDHRMPSGFLTKTYCFGFEENIDGKVHKVIYEIMPDDTVHPIETK